ncbi:hypothetical protein H4R99_007845 [Coemansia sp. RSA 1722]|nr:slightly ste11-like protein [Coemansia sp. RSA 485]KAJ2588294.1 hypothetical protein H4R99_007845 [Coemansia sp. RSA 1722]
MTNSPSSFPRTLSPVSSVSTPSGLESSLLVPAEYAIAGQHLNEVDLPERTGVTYAQTTVIVPSDRQLIMIPSTISIPLNCTIAAVLFAPANFQGTGAGSSTDRDTVGESETPAGTTTAMVRVPQPFNQQGSFIQLLPTSASVESSSDIAHSLPVSPPIHPQSAPLPTSTPLLTVRRQSQVSSIYNADDLLENETANPTSSPEDEGSDDELAGSDNENNPLTTSEGLTSTPLSIEQSTKMLKRYREMAEENEVSKIKRPANSFIRYRSDFHKKAAANGDKRTADEISREAGRIWKTMSKEDRKPYQEPAKVNMDVYKVKATDRKKAEMEMKKLAKKAISMIKGKGKGKGKAASSSRSHSFSNPAHTPGAGSISGAGLGMQFGVGPLQFSPVISAGTTSFAHANALGNMHGSIAGTSSVTVPPDFGHTINSSNIPSLVSRIPLSMAGSVEFMPSLFNEPMIMSVNTDGSMPQSMRTQQVMVTVDPTTNSSPHAHIRAMSAVPRGQHDTQSYYPVGIQGAATQSQAQVQAQAQAQVAAPVPIQAQGHNSTLTLSQAPAQIQTQPHIQIPAHTHIQAQTPLIQQASTPQQWDVNSFLGSIGALTSASTMANPPVSANMFGEPTFVAGLSESSAQTPVMPFSTAQMVYPDYSSAANSPQQNVQGASPSVGPSTNTPNMLGGVFSPIPNIELVEVSNNMPLAVYSISQQQQAATQQYPHQHQHQQHQHQH